MTDHSGNQEKAVESMQPQLCVKCNEFFGNPANLNMCSSCFRACQNANQKSQSSSTPSPKEVKEVSDAALRGALSGLPSTPAGTSVVVPKPEAKVACIPCEPNAQAVAVAAAAPSRPPQKHKNRCYSCRKKIGLTGFTCRCGYIFCSEHRYSDKHDCPYDYKLAGREDIAKANPKVVASKINKI